MGVQHTFPPRLMQATAAAHYLGVSVSTLRKIDLPRREWGSLRLYDRLDLDRYVDGMPIEGGEVEEANPCDELFGVSG